MKRLLILVVGLIAVCAVALLALRAWHPGLVQLAQFRAIPATQANTPSLQATWLGCAGLYLSDGESSLLIDPFFSRPPGLLRMALNASISPDETQIRAMLARLGIDRLDAVLVSHSHHDHSMDSGVIARLTGAKLIGSQSTLNIGRGAGLAEGKLELAPLDRPWTAGRFQVKFVTSRHTGLSGGIPNGEITQPLQTPARYLDYKQGGSFSILVRHPEASLLHVGSAGHLESALVGESADIAFLGVAMIDDMETYLRETVDAVGARRVVPIHWDDFTRPLDAPLRPMPLIVRLDRFLEHIGRTRPALERSSFDLLTPVLLQPVTAQGPKSVPDRP